MQQSCCAVLTWRGRGDRSFFLSARFEDGQSPHKIFTETHPNQRCHPTNDIMKGFQFIQVTLLASMCQGFTPVNPKSASVVPSTTNSNSKVGIPPVTSSLPAATILQTDDIALPPPVSDTQENENNFEEEAPLVPQVRKPIVRSTYHTECGTPIQCQRPTTIFSVLIFPCLCPHTQPGKELSLPAETILIGFMPSRLRRRLWLDRFGLVSCRLP